LQPRALRGAATCSRHPGREHRQKRGTRERTKQETNRVPEAEGTADQVGLETLWAVDAPTSKSPDSRSHSHYRDIIGQYIQVRVANNEHPQRTARWRICSPKSTSHECQHSMACSTSCRSPQYGMQHILHKPSAWHAAHPAQALSMACSSTPGALAAHCPSRTCWSCEGSTMRARTQRCRRCTHLAQIHAGTHESSRMGSAE
jgi:hypothetical protein